MLGKWDKRWFVLRAAETVLYYYRSEDDGRNGAAPSGSVECRGSQIERTASSSSGSEVDFVLFTKERKLRLRAPTETVFQSWASVIKGAGGIEVAEVAPAKAPVARTAKPTRETGVPVAASLDGVLAQVQIGDVILFKCNFTHTAVLRALTSWRYDHVAVVVDGGDGQMCLLEACQLGVVVLPLRRRVYEYKKHYADTIVWRRLLAERTDACKAASRAFVQKVNGMKYCYDARKILFTPRIGKGESDEGSYFCTELVAGLWQACGLLDSGCKPASFWPPDYAEGGQIERWLAESCALAPEVVLETGELPPPPPRSLPLPDKGRDPMGVLREGYLEKLPVSSTLGKWQRRYIVLSVDRLAWQVSATSGVKEPRGWLQLTAASEASLDDPSCPSLLYVRSAPSPGGTKLTLRAAPSAPAEVRHQLLREWHAAFERSKAELCIAAASSSAADANADAAGRDAASASAADADAGTAGGAAAAADADLDATGGDAAAADDDADVAGGDTAAADAHHDAAGGDAVAAHVDADAAGGEVADPERVEVAFASTALDDGTAVDVTDADAREDAHASVNLAMGSDDQEASQDQSG